MKLKKLGAFASTLIISLTLPTMNPTAIATSKMTTWGADAVEQIATCINSSGQKDVVNVLFLIDESGSLNWNDPDGLRVEGIKATLDQFRSIAVQKPYFKVNRAITTFADGFNSKIFFTVIFPLIWPATVAESASIFPNIFHVPPITNR